MSGFLYFLNGARDAQIRDLLPMRGLGHVVGDGLTTCGANTGPGGAAGIVVAGRDLVPAGQVGFYPKQQTWRPVPGQADAWVGLTNDARPTPADLARREMIDGHKIELGDGNAWQVPVALSWEGPEARACGRLPCTMDLDADGNWVYGDVQTRYRHLWELAIEWVEVKQLVSEHLATRGTAEGLDDPRLHNDWVYGRTVEILSVNYRIGPAEAALLGLFVTDRKWTVLDGLIDDEGLKQIFAAAGSERVEKKTDASPDTSPG